jgi:hypothetical protein
MERVAAMTVGYLLTLGWRHRLVIAVCLVLTGVAVFLGSSPIESWNGRVSVVLLPPEGGKGNAIAPTTASLIATTGIVAHSVNGASEESQTVSSDLTLTSLGVERGWSVRQPNAGGQWDVNYEEARLDVKSSGRTVEEASAQMTEALAAIEDALTVLEVRRGVSERERIRLDLSPDRPVFIVQSGSRIRVMAGAGLAGLLMTIAVVLAADRLTESRWSATKPRSADGSALGEFADSHR